MARRLVPVHPPAAGAIGAVAVVDDLALGVRLSLDIDDLEVTVTVDGHAGTAVRSTDDLTVNLFPPAGPVGLVAWAAALDATGLGHLTAVGFGVVQTNSYGATVAGVEALVTDLTLTYETNPSIGDVAAWIDEVAGQVTARIAPLTGLPDDVTRRLNAQAAGVVHLGAGAYTADAAHPERTTSQGDRAYGAVLWSRYKAALESLAVAAAEARTNADVAPAEGRHKAAASFPAPAWRRDTPL